MSDSVEITGSTASASKLKAFKSKLTSSILLADAAGSAIVGKLSRFKSVVSKARPVSCTLGTLMEVISASVPGVSSINASKSNDRESSLVTLAVVSITSGAMLATGVLSTLKSKLNSLASMAVAVSVASVEISSATGLPKLPVPAQACAGLLSSEEITSSTTGTSIVSEKLIASEASVVKLVLVVSSMALI